MTATQENREIESESRDIRVAIVEDHVRLRGVLEKLIRFSPGMVCVGVYKSGEDLLKAIPEVKPEIVSLDLSMPRMSGIDAIERIHQESPEIKCILFSGHSERSYVEQCLARGGAGYIVKGDSEEFLKGIREVSAGRRYVSPRFAKLLEA